MRVLVLTVLALVVWLLPSSAQFVSEQNRREALQHYRNGQELMSAERFEKAADEFTNAIAKDHLLTLAHHGLGEAYMALRRYPSAIVAFTRCREAFLTLHGLRERDRVDVERQRDEEIRELNDTIRRLRAIPNTNLRVAKLEARVQDLVRQRTSNSATFQSPPELSLALGSAYFRNEQLSEAEREWREALVVNPRMGEAYNNLAALYAITERKKEAEDAVRQAERAGYRVNPRLKEDIKNLAN
jgi:tetratricopeptide (TPR) repeat protein